MRTRRLLRFAAGCLAVSLFAPAAPPDVFAEIRFLEGRWDGSVTGQPGSGKSERAYEFILRDRFLEERTTSVYPNERHEHRAVFSYDRLRKKIVLRQFHVEGFVNQYVLDTVTDGGRTLVFVSESIENLPAGWRAREAYRIAGKDEFTETFSVAEPGKDFEVYSETKLKRRER